MRVKAYPGTLCRTRKEVEPVNAKRTPGAALSLSSLDDNELLGEIA